MAAGTQSLAGWAEKRDAQAEGQKISGFTLIEIVISLIVASILGAILIQLMGTAVQRSSEGLTQIGISNDLVAVMEEVTSDYDTLIADDREDNADGVAALVQLRDNLENLGSYNVNGVTGTAKWVSFADSGTQLTENAIEDTVNLDVLKVTLVKENHSLTALFTQ
jgi:prepilin-type N-terminal cleavage/methylation domain-containing protein